MDKLATENGVSYFLQWVQTRFMEVEVSKVAQLMTDLFKRGRRRSDQPVRDFNVEFERMVLRLTEIQCHVPPLIKAWLYLDKLRLSEQEELALSSSVNNEYDCKKLQTCGFGFKTEPSDGRGLGEVKMQKEVASDGRGKAFT